MSAFPRLSSNQYRNPLTDIIFDNASSSGYKVSSATNNFNHTVGPYVTSSILVVTVHIFTGGGAISGITYDSVALSLAKSQNDGVYGTEIWYLVAPSVGTHEVQVTVNGSQDSIASAASYSNVHQTNPIDITGGANTNNEPATTSVTPLTNRTRVVGGFTTEVTTAIVSGAGQNPRFKVSGSAGTGAFDDTNYINYGESKSMTWTGSGSTKNWVIALAALRRVGEEVSASSYSTSFMLMGMGM